MEQPNSSYKKYYFIISSCFPLYCMINILRQTKKFPVGLMNRLPHLITQSIDWYDGLTRCIMNPFSFFWYFSLENCIWPPFFVHYLHTSGETTSWIILVCLLRLACLFLAGRYMTTSSWSSTSRMELYIFLMTRFSTSFYIASYGAAIRFLFWTFSLFFFFRLFYLSTQFLCFEPFFCHLLVTLFPSF